MSNTVSRYSDADLAEFKALIDRKIEKAEEQIRILQDQIMDITENAGDEFGGDWVDDSSTSSEVEMLNNMAIRQRKHLQDLKNALVRIKNKTYGICVVSGELIDRKRLLAVPTTTKSLAAKNLNDQPLPPKKDDDDDEEDKPKKVIPSKPKEKKVITRVIRKSTAPKPPAPKDFDDEEDDDFPMGGDDFFDDDPEIDKSFTDFDDIPDDDGDGDDQD